MSRNTKTSAATDSDHNKLAVAVLMPAPRHWMIANVS